MKKIMTLLSLILIVFILNLTNAYALDEGKISIEVGGTKLDLKEGKYEYSLLTSFRSKKLNIEVTTEEKDVKVEGDGLVELNDKVTYRKVIISKDGKKLTYNIKLTKKDTPKHPIDLSKVHLYLDINEETLNLGSMSHNFGKNVKKVYVGVRIEQEGVEVTTRIGFYDLEEDETVIPVTFKSEDDEFTHYMYVKHTGEEEDNDSAVVKSNRNNTVIRKYLFLFAFAISIFLLLLELHSYISLVRSKEKKEKKKEKIKKLLREVFLEGILMITSLLLLGPFAIESLVGHSMDPTLQTKSKVISQIYFVEYKRGDIVTATIEKVDTGVTKNICKRIIGMPGDTLEIKNNVLYINGKEYKEDYIKEPMNTFDLKITLKDDEYFLMGDNRNNSSDSRLQGVVKRSQIKSKILFHK